jgi:dTDP-4-amino-4,6-dideoxygalactose transaminase
MIPFNKPAFSGKEIKYIKKAVSLGKISGNGYFTNKCCAFFEEKLGAAKSFLTTSCTHALEMAALLSGIGENDEVIMPSYTFTSTANAFILRGAKAVFVDIRKDTMNMVENLIEDAVTKRTKILVPVHYAGVSCEMDKINLIAKKHKLLVVEDAAQGVMSTYKGAQLGTLGDFGCFSFHETKNYTCGEGGALLMKDRSYAENAEIIWEKGTNRQKFFRGEVDKYTWVGAGSSYLPSELNAAYLWAQLERAAELKEARLKAWNLYYRLLKPLQDKGFIELPFIPDDCGHNGHMFYIKTKDQKERTSLIDRLKSSGIMAIFHYVPLHSSPAGKKFGRFHGEDKNTVKESARLLRLPMYNGIKEKDIAGISSEIAKFFTRS